MRRLSREFVVGLTIFVLAFAVFRLSKQWQVFDSAYTMLFAENLLRHGGFSVSPEVLPQLQGLDEEKLKQPGVLPYQFVSRHGRLYYFFPPGSTILSLPFAVLFNLGGLSTLDANGHYDFAAERRMQHRLAPLLMAVLCSMTFLTARLILPLGWSVLVTVAAALGTPIWSSASRAVMADTWGVCLLGFVIWMIVRAETGQGRLRPILLATLLSWLYFAKPTYSVSIMAITVYILLYHRRILLPYVLTGGLWLSVFVAWSRHHFDSWLPAYYSATRLQFLEARDALPGVFFSPSRGIFVFVPLLWFVGYLLVRYWRWQRWRRFVWMSLAIFAAHMVVLIGNVPWNHGHSYGPRLTVAVIPWLVLLGVIALDARLRSRAQTAVESRARWRIEFAIGAILLFLSISIHAVGAFSSKAVEWNVKPTNVDFDPPRVWDWSDPQFLAPFVRR